MFKSTIAVLFSSCAAFFVMAADLDDCFIRHDYSSGVKETFYGKSSSKPADFGTVQNHLSVYGPDGVNTAVHPDADWGTIFGSKNSDSILNKTDWSVASCFRVADVEGGVVYSLGRMNSDSINLKEVALCSSSENGKLYLKVLTREKNGGAKRVESSTEVKVKDTFGFHAYVLSFTAGEQAGAGTFNLYCDGALVATVSTTSNFMFGNGFQYNGPLSLGTGDLGCKKVSGNKDYAFSDMRILLSDLSSDDAKMYAELYPQKYPDFSPVDSYAYVQSYGANAIDTKYFAAPNTTFAVDFQLIEDSNVGDERIFGCHSGNDGENYSNDGLTSALYLNGTGNYAFTVYSQYVKGKTWLGLWPIDTERRVFTTTIADENSTKGKLVKYSRESESVVRENTVGAPHAVAAKNPIYLFANNNAGAAENFSKSRIYSFCAYEGGSVPAVFLAPAVKEGAAGFYNVVTGEFLSEKQAEPAEELLFNPGVGQASDYRYRSGKFYARFYAVSANEEKGKVKFDGGESAGVVAQYIEPTRSATIIAVPAEGVNNVIWSGDVWAIEEYVDNYTIKVKSATAAKIVAEFSSVPVWSNRDGSGTFDSAENWSTGMVPAAGKIEFDAEQDTVVTVNGNRSFDSITVKSTGNIEFCGEGSITANVIEVESAARIVTGGVLAVSGIKSAGDFVLSPAAGSNTINLTKDSVIEGDLTIETDRSIAFNVASSVTAGTFTVNGAVNAVVAIKRTGSFYAGKATVAGGVLQQASDTALQNTPFIYVKNGGTFDIMAKSIRQETPIYIEGAGAGDWPYALATTAGAMAAGNYLYDLYLTGDATIGAGQFKIGRSNAASVIELNEYTLTAKSWITFRNVNTKKGTIDLQAGGTLNTWNNLNADHKKYNGTTLIVRKGSELENKTDRTIFVSNLVLDGGTVKGAKNFGVLEEFSGYGTLARLELRDDHLEKLKPSLQSNYINVTAAISGTIDVDTSSIPKNYGKRIPLLCVPQALKDSVKFGKIPTQWSFSSEEKDGNIYYYLKNMGFLVIIR